MASSALSSTLRFFLEGFGYMFYCVHPRRFALSENDPCPDIMATHGTPMFFVLIGLEMLGLSLTKGNHSVQYRFNDVLTCVSLGIHQSILFHFCKAPIGAVYEAIYRNCRLADFDVKRYPITSYVALFLGADLSYYWAHRLMHTFHLGWLGHSVHHGGEDYMLACALRQGAAQPFVSWITSLPLALFFPAPAYNMHHQCNVLYQFWVHTELIGRLGPLEYVLNTPMAHRMHHRPPGNCNYAGVLILWDRLFGTYVAETNRQDYYGLADQPQTFSPLKWNLQHLPKWWRVKFLKKDWLPSPLRWFFAQRAKHKLSCSPQALLKPIVPLDDAESTWAMPEGPSKREKFDGAQLGLGAKFLPMIFGIIGLVSFIKMGSAIGRQKLVLGASSLLSLHVMGHILDNGIAGPALLAKQIGDFECGDK